MYWRGIQVGVVLATLLMVFVLIMGLAAGPRWLAVIGGAGLLVVAVVQVITIRQRNRQTPDD